MDDLNGEEEAPQELSAYGVHLGMRSIVRRMKGDALKSIGILDGDQLVCEQREPKHGETVLILHNGTDTARRYKVTPSGPLLVPGETPRDASMDADGLVILGVVRAVIRALD